MTDWAIRFAVNAAMWCGWTVMIAGGVTFTALFVWLAAEMVWRAWRAWHGVFNIVEAFGALREKKAAAGAPAAHPTEPDEDERWAVDRAADLLDGYAEYIHRVRPEDIEQHPYLPEVESVAAHLREFSRRAAANDKDPA